MINEQVEDRFVNLITMPIVNKAFVFASAAHAAVGQTRKYSGAPYIVHPVEVCVLVSMVEHTPEMLAGALLHDTVEDTQVTLELIQAHFGPVVMNHVSWLTDISKKSDGNRATRKEIDRKHTHMAPKQSQTIKCADLIANTKDICQADPDFAKVYMKEKRLLLEGMDADKTLMDYAWKLINDWEVQNGKAPEAG
jgi:(p)ppGpp synthase/HD superfamily hydrolase